MKQKIKKYIYFYFYIYFFHNFTDIMCAHCMYTRKISRYEDKSTNESTEANKTIVNKLKIDILKKMKTLQETER